MTRRAEVVVAEGIVEATVDGKVYRGKWQIKQVGKRPPVKQIWVAGENFIAGLKTTQLGNMLPESLAHLLLRELIAQRKTEPNP